MYYFQVIEEGIETEMPFPLLQETSPDLAYML